MGFSELIQSFPEVRYFVEGFRESALKKIINEINSSNETVRSIKNIQLTRIPSPYLDGSIPVNSTVKTINIETKRGCPYKCSYCAHDTVHHQRIIEKSVLEVKREILFLIQQGVEKINIIDPVFNCGKTYLEILEFITGIKNPPLFTLQYKLKRNMRKFLELCQKGNIKLEIGIQTLDPCVLSNINRQDDPDSTLELLKEVTDYVKFEISIIFGLPGQTIMSFEDTIAKIQTVTQYPIHAFPLMLLQGTRLYEEKEKWGFREETDKLGIPYVRESNSFSAFDWNKMKQISKKIRSDIKNEAL